MVAVETLRKLASIAVSSLGELTPEEFKQRYDIDIGASEFRSYFRLSKSGKVIVKDSDRFLGHVRAYHNHVKHNYSRLGV